MRNVMLIPDRIWRFFQQRLKYSDEELECFRTNQRNQDVITAGFKMMNKRIILEVVESHGCNSEYRVGDKLCFDATGNLLTELSLKKICAYSLNSALMMVFTASEMLYAGMDPNQMKFKKTSCFDVGLREGGWGRVVYELRIEETNV
jgi:uncharacterized repeat protein (TIGR04076 family)